MTSVEEEEEEESERIMASVFLLPSLNSKALCGGAPRSSVRRNFEARELTKTSSPRDTQSIPVVYV